MGSRYQFKSILLFFITGIVLTPIFGYIAFVFANGGHGTYLIALALFPWAMKIGSAYFRIP